MTETKLATSVNGEGALGAESVAAFEARLRGPLLRPGEPAYDEACAIWNGMIDKRPALVAQPQGAADVIECVNFAREGSVPLSVRGGGHNIAGTAIAEGGLMIDHTPRKGVYVDVERGVIRVEPGCNWGDADRETQLHGLVVPGGIVSHTGVAGFTLGGGFGWASRKYGLASDNLLSADIVTAEGKLIRASETEHPDLFWALRGGGGNFGIVTSFEFRACTLGPEVMAGIVFHPMDKAREVIGLYREITQSAPDELCCLLVMRMAPPAPFLPEEVHGTPVVGIAACYVGSIEDGAKAVRPIKEFGEPVGDAIAPKPFTAYQAMLDAGAPFGRRYYWKSDYFADLDPAMDDVLIEHASRFQSPHSSLLLMHLGGETNRIGETDTAAGNRDAEYVLNIQGAWEDPADDDRNVAWARDFWQAARPYSTGGTYINFLTEDAEEDRVREAFLSESYDRLVKVKTKYDPDNMFRSNQNIRPKA